MAAQYVGVSFDGVKLASADANRTGDLGRATSFEAFSISSIESIEIARTTSPDMDADSPAGTINMKTRRAYERSGRRIGYNVSMNLNSEEFHFKKTYGPDDKKNMKALPNWGFEYSDVFFNRRLGIVLSHSHANSYTEQYRHNLTYNKTPFAGNATVPADPRPMVLTALNFKDGPKFILKDTYTMTVDFKATDRLSVSLMTIYNFAEGEFYNRELTFNAATNNTTNNTGRQYSLGDLTTVRTNGLATNTSRNVAIGGTNASKRTHTITLAPRFEYKVGSWTIEGIAGYSRSFNNYEALEQGFARSETVNNLTSDWVATRPNIQSHEWTFTQTSGNDWFNLSNFTNPRLTNEGRYARTEIYNGELSARWVAPFRRVPTVFKFGAKWAEEGRKNGNETSYYTWQYIGPGGGTTGSWGAIPTGHTFDTGTTNILTVVNSAGLTGMIPRPDRNAIAALFKSNPEYFVNNATADNYYNAFIAPRRDVIQTVTAGYGMMDFRPTRSLQIRTGVRMEETQNDAREFDPLSKAQMAAAGFPLSATTARPTTIAGYEYQYMTNPRVTRTKKYRNYFPMISAKYTVGENLQFHFGANKAISRPPIDSLTGAWLINEDSRLITSPNPNLLPEYSDNLVARAAYYFEPAGQFSVTFTQNNIQNLRSTRRGTAEEFGVADDPEYGDFEFQAPFNIANPVRFRGMELAYSQSFSHLPGAWKGLTANMSYTRSYASRRTERVSPHRVTSSLGYRYKRFSTRLGIVWHDDTPWETTYGRYKRHTIKYDLGGEYRVNPRVSVYFQGRNIFNDSQRWYESPLVEGEGGALRILENYGANWVFGVKGTF